MANEEQATFQIDLQDNVSGPAESAKKALEGLRQQIQRDEQQLKGLQTAMKRLQSGSVVNVQQFRALQTQLEATKGRIAQAQGAILDLGGALGPPRQGTSRLSQALEAMGKQAQGVGGPVGGFVSRLGNLRGLLAGGVIGLGLVAIGAAVVGMTVAMVAATAAFYRFGLAAADARRNQLLHLEAMTKTRSIWGYAAGDATKMQAAIDRVSASVALGRDELVGYTEKLHRMGLRGSALDDALEGVAIKAATQGSAAADQFAGLAASVALTGGSVRGLANDVKARLGGIAAAQLLSLGVQAKKLRENLSAMFDNLKIEGALKAIKSIGDLFSQATVSGRALRSMVEVMFKPLSAALEYIAPLGKRFFQGMIIGGQFLVLGMLKLALAFKRTFGFEWGKKIDLTTAALYAGGLTVAAMVSPVLLLAGAFAALVAPLVAVGAAALWMQKLAGKALTFFQETDWAKLGRSIADGVVKGVKDNAARALQSVKNLAGDAWEAFREALGIHSPSRAFADLGRQLPAGVSVGIEQGAPKAQESAARMVSVPSVGSAPARARGEAVARPSITVNVTVNTSATDARGIAQDFRQAFEEVLDDVLSGVSLQVGAAR